jgi:small subunit ribosomal protein S17
MTSDATAQASQQDGERSEPHRKVLQGIVMSTKMQKTVVVAVESIIRHPLYKKTLRRTKRYKAHDETNECVLGDVVRIVETRPLSREKRWRVAEIMTRGNVAEVQPQVIGAEIEGRTAE